MPKFVRLIAPLGADEASYSTVRYFVHDDGTIVVPAEAAQDLMHGAGFAMAPEDQQPGGDYTPPPERRR